MGKGMKYGVSLMLFLVALLFSQSALAKTIEVPLLLKHPLLSQLITEQLFTGKNKTLRVADDGSGCQFLKLSQPKTSTREGLLRIRAKAYARFGQAWGDECMLLWEWHGQVEVDEKLSIVGNGNQIKAKVVKTTLLTPQGKVDSVNNTLWQWLTKFLQPEFEQATIDIRQPLKETKEVMSKSLANIDHVLLNQIVSSIKINRLVVLPQGVEARISANLPPRTTKIEPAKQLTEKEIAQLEKRLKHVDSFITFIAKQLARDTKDILVKRDLLSILLETRFTLVDIAISEKTFSEDPVRRVFINTWRSLIPVMKKIADEQPANVAMNYLSFISAGEALTLIDSVGPHIGLDISVNGLRRLARVLVHQTKIDPTAYGEDVDSELRKLFGFGKAIKVSSPPPQSLIDWFIKPAWAGVDPAIVKKLNNSIPRKKYLKNYLKMVNSVLDHVALEQIKESKIQRNHQTMFRNLVKATAWQETCWRQYFNDKGMRMPVRSRQGDLGMMQINPRVWRGFYKLHNIKWDIVYNAKAGTEILYHYFNDYALRKKEDKKTGSIDNLARASYSAYNGGPKSLTRYRNPKASKRLKKIDTKFNEKYKAMKRGNYTEVMSCY